MRYLYEHPQAVYPYSDLVQTIASARLTTLSMNGSIPVSLPKIAMLPSWSSTPRNHWKTSSSARLTADRMRQHCTCCRHSRCAKPGSGQRERRGRRWLREEPAAGAVDHRRRHERPARRRHPAASTAGTSASLSAAASRAGTAGLPFQIVFGSGASPFMRKLPGARSTSAPMSTP